MSRAHQSSLEHGGLSARLLGAPPSVLRDSAWSAWRRWFKRPPAPARARAGAWSELLYAVDRWQDLSVSFWPDAIGSGIFGDSITRVDFLDSFAPDVPLTLNGRVAPGGRVRTVSLACPLGRLTQTVRVPRFEFDITEVQAIAASKSSDRCFETVREFGQDFVAFKSVPLDAAGLAAMLAHHEVRLAHGTGSDHLSLRWWDGRLVLKNDGGSHHFAAAAYIADSIGRAVPLRAPVNVVSLNDAVVAWLAGRFEILAVPHQVARKLLGTLARLLGECYSMRVPEIVCLEATVLLLPRSAASIDDVVQVLRAAGAVPLQPWFSDLLARQSRNRARCASRFGDRLAMLDAPLD